MRLHSTDAKMMHLRICDFTLWMYLHSMDAIKGEKRTNTFGYTH